MRSQLNSLHNQSGLSLIEIMVAMTLSLFLLAGVGILYINTFTIQRDSNQRVDLNDNSRTALTVISKHLRSAGYANGLGIGSLDTNGLAINPANSDCDNLGAVYNSLTPFLAGRSSADILGCAVGQVGNYTVNAGSPSDWILFKGAVGPALEFDPANGVNQLQVNTNYIFSNTQEGQLFRGTIPPATPEDEIIREYQFSLFYLFNNNLQLTRLVNNSLVTDTVANNVESMRVVLGFDDNEDGQVNRYTGVPANTQNWTANQWNNIISATIYILATSDNDPGYQDTRSYLMGDITVAAPNDNRHRTLASTTVYLYNQAYR